MNVMAIGAHPDDIEFGCGGTLLKHHRDGDNVIYVCMTNTESVDATTGKTIRSKEQLKEETKKATEKLKVKYLEYLPFIDLHVPFNFESVSKLESLIKKYDVIKACYQKAQHYINLASNSLSVFKDCEEKNILENLTSFSLSRNF